MSFQIITKDGQLSAKTGLPWIHFIRSSRDIYEQNIEAVKLRDDGGVFLRVTRNLTRGELLCGWYEEGYARELNVPYLTLENIRGKLRSWSVSNLSLKINLSIIFSKCFEKFQSNATSDWLSQIT